jgi:hypothetical protein
MIRQISNENESSRWLHHLPPCSPLAVKAKAAKNHIKGASAPFFVSKKSETKTI